MKLRLFATMVMVAACGPGGGGAPDAGPDGEVAPDGSGATVHVTLQGYGVPLDGVPVAFQGADGRVLEVAVTDERGEATGAMEPDGMITYPSDHLPTYAIETRTGVQPGDELVIGGGLPPDAVEGHLHPTLPGAVAGAFEYRMQIACAPSDAYTFETVASPDEPIVFDVAHSCVAGDGTVSVAAIAYDDAFHMLAYTVAPAATLDPDGSTDLALPAWRTDVDPLTFTGTGLDPTAFDGDLSLDIVDGGRRAGYLDARIDTITGGAFTTTVDVPHGMPHPVLSAAIEFDIAGPLIASAGFQRTAPVATTTTITQADLLPFVSDVTLDSADPARPAAAWTFASAFPATTGFQIDISDPDRGYWTVHLAAGTPPTDFHFPELPDELAANRPTANTTFSGLFLEIDDATGTRWSGARLF